MSGLTYRQMFEILENVSPEQIDMNVSVYLAWEDEYFEVEDVTFATKENDVLDAEHPILYVDDGSSYNKES
jgi:hypothetical protein